jgi:hypothetical protein
MSKPMAFSACHPGRIVEHEQSGIRRAG